MSEREDRYTDEELMVLLRRFGFARAAGIVWLAAMLRLYGVVGTLLVLLATLLTAAAVVCAVLLG